MLSVEPDCNSGLVSELKHHYPKKQCQEKGFLAALGVTESETPLTLRDFPVASILLKWFPLFAACIRRFARNPDQGVQGYAGPSGWLKMISRTSRLAPTTIALSARLNTGQR